MAQSIPPIPQIQFGGIVTAGHPLNRPRGSAIRCRDFRPMPGNWLRLRGGRTLRSAAVSGSYRQFYEFRKSDAAGGVYHLAQHTLSGVMRWGNLNLATYGMGYIVTIDQTHGLADPEQAAITTVRNKVFMANGLGVRGANSQPPLSSWDGTTVRYVGLDAFCPTSNPSVAFAAGAGYNQVLTGVDIYAGLYNSTTGHFSNGVLCGSIPATSVTEAAANALAAAAQARAAAAAAAILGLATLAASLIATADAWDAYALTLSATGTITVSNLSRLAYASNNATELSELYYVFYATIDGGEVPYLILNSTLDGPYKVAVGSASASLSIASGTTNGWDLDLTQEMPTENFPPRPMSRIAYVNGRIYGAPLIGGSGTAYRDFQYTVTDKEASAVVWSVTIDDYTDTDFCGTPEEAWPLRNKKYTPNGERPILVAEAPGGSQVLVATKTATFLLKETVDGLHEWDTISAVQGILNVKTFVNTPRGPMWMDQFKQIVRLVPGSFQLEVVSSDYAELLTWPGYSPIGRCAAYLLDPANQIDRYQVWREDGTSVIHDFWLGGQAYETTCAGGEVYTAAAGLLDAYGQRHNIVAAASLFTQEADPVTGLIPTRDQKTDGTYLEVNGDYIGQWDAFGDADNRKTFSEVKVVGDAAVSAVLGVSPVTLTWYKDLAAAGTVATFAKTPQCLTDLAYKGGLASGNAYWLKYRVQLAGHSGDGFLTLNNGLSLSGDLPPVPYGSIYELRTTVRVDPANRT